MCEHAGLRRDSEVRAQIVEHDEYISYPVWAIGSPITRPRHGTTRGGAPTHVRPDLLRLFVEEGLGLVKTEDRPAASKLAHKTGPNLQNPAREPHRSPRTAAAKAGKATAPASAERPS